MSINSWAEAVELYDEMLDDVYGCVSVAGLEYETSRVLKDIDPIAYREGLFAYGDSLEGVLMIAGLIIEATKEPGIPTYMVPHIEDQIDYTMTGHAAGEPIGGK